MKLNIVSLIIGFLLVMQVQSVAAQTSSMQPTGGSGRVENATFTSNVVDGAPVDYREEFPNNTSKLYYYTELLNLKGQTVMHRWKHEGKVMQEIEIPVNNERMPAWTTSKMKPQWAGDWAVEVVNESGKVIHMDSFSFNAPL